MVGYTRNDIKTWSNLVARFLTAAGVTHDDVVQIAFGYGMFTGAFGLHYGAETIGASVIPMGGGNTEKQIMIMQDYKTTALVCTPSYALTLADRMEKMGIDPKSLSLKVGLFGGEPWSEAMRREIESRLCHQRHRQLRALRGHRTGRCRRMPCNKCGMHIFEDAFIPEIIDPETGAVLPPGSIGELVLTTLTKEAFPMIRYRTRDITRLDYAPCACGRTHGADEEDHGASDDMLIIKGVNVFPSQIEEVLLAIEGCEPHYQLVVERKGAMDVLEVQIEVTENIFFDEMKMQRAFLEKVEKKIESVLGVGATRQAGRAEQIPRHEGKAQRVIDRRKL